MAYIKNISHEEVLHLADQVSADKGQIVSKTLAQNGHVSVTLFAFSKDEEIATHDSTGDAMVLVLEGTGQFTVDGKEYMVEFDIFGTNRRKWSDTDVIMLRMVVLGVVNAISGQLTD